MQKLKIKGGKLFDGDTEIKPEIGNREQIEFLKKEEIRMAGFDEGFVLDVDIEKTFTAKAYFQCKCNGGTVFLEDDMLEDEDEVPDCFIGKVFTCRKCKTEYIASVEDDELIIKIKS